MESTDLQTEVEFYRQNQIIVEQEIKALIEDNQKLSQKVGMLLKEKLENARRTAIDTNVDKELEECKKQVGVLTKDRDSLHVLWQTSQKTIEALEFELQTYQGYDSRSHQSTAEEKRDLQLKLETALTDYIELESKLKDLTSKHSSIENELKRKNNEIITYKERGKELEKKLEEANRTVEEYRINLGVQIRSNEDLRNQLALCQKESVGLVKKEAEAKTKVAEALQLYDVVAGQRDEAFRKISDLTEEVAKLERSLANVKHEAESVFKQEMEDMRGNYNEKVADMLLHIRNLDAELVEKGLLLNKALREVKILQTANDNYLKQHNKSIKCIDPRLELAEQRLEAMFQELVTSERRNIQLVCEKQCIAMDIQRLQDLNTRESKRRDWEEKILKTECEELRVQVEHLQKSLSEAHGMVNNLQNILTSRVELSQKMVSTKEEELEELNKHLENQMELNRKWKESYVEMTAKLKARIDILQKENDELKLNLGRGSSNAVNDVDTTVSS